MRLFIRASQRDPAGPTVSDSSLRRLAQVSFVPQSTTTILTPRPVRSGRVERGTDTLVHNWSSPVAGDDIRAIFTIKGNGSVAFRG